jgi:ethanolamine utilization microcompartment shell protein EutL
MIRGMVTFVVRVWIPGEPDEADASDGLKGTVEHIDSGDVRVFASESALLTFVREHLSRAHSASP